MTLTARYPGIPCADCGDLIEPGEQIEGADPGWRHIECFADLDTDDQQQACPHCWLIHPEGKCDR